jgi:hypothetical protein
MDNQDVRRSAVDVPEESISPTVMGKSNLPTLQMSVTSQNAMNQDFIATGLEEQNFRQESLSIMSTSQSPEKSEKLLDPQPAEAPVVETVPKLASSWEVAN